MKIVRYGLRRHKSSRNDKGTFLNSSMVKCWKIFGVRNKRVVRDNLILDYVNLSARMRLKSP